MRTSGLCNYAPVLHWIWRYIMLLILFSRDSRERIVSKQLKGLTDSNPALRRGAALALGYLPKSFLSNQERVSYILQCILFYWRYTHLGWPLGKHIWGSCWLHSWSALQPGKVPQARRINVNICFSLTSLIITSFLLSLSSLIIISSLLSLFSLSLSFPTTIVRSPLCWFHCKRLVRSRKRAITEMQRRGAMPF